jgi:hypothetical protein
MIICPVCKTENDLFSLICKKCGGFLQNRVPNLDLFDTIWKVIENPRSAFGLIMRAEHKNYSLFLYTLSGISIAFASFWQFKMGDRFENVFPLILWAILIGVPIGIVLCPFISSLHWILSKIIGGKTGFRASLGITSYSLTPLVISLLFVLPIELLTFGMYIFTFNPHPMTIKPISYFVLIGFDLALAAWAVILMIIGTQVGNQVSLWKSILIVVILSTLTCGSLIISGEYALKYL